MAKEDKEDIYDEEGREELENESEISPEEEGFMKGYDEAEKEEEEKEKEKEKAKEEPEEKKGKDEDEDFEEE